MGVGAFTCVKYPRLGTLGWKIPGGVIDVVQSLYSKHGGVHFLKKASPEEINSFVSQLPDAKRNSLFDVLGELDQAGLISIVNDGKFADGEGELEGSEEC
jgi:hypothetical protein